MPLSTKFSHQRTEMQTIVGMVAYLRTRSSDLEMEYQVNRMETSIWTTNAMTFKINGIVPDLDWSGGRGDYQ